MRRLALAAASMLLAGAALQAAAPALANASASFSLNYEGCLIICGLENVAILAELLDPEELPTKVDITRYPKVWGKGETVVIEGNVTAVDGRPAAGVPVRLVLERAPSRPGLEIGTVMTDDAGRFRFEGRPPGDAETLDHRIVAYALPTRTFTESYHASDDSVPTTLVSDTAFLSTPRWNRTATGYDVEATLVDEGGLPLANAPVSVTIDGETRGARTDANGVVRAAVPGPGPHELSFSFGGRGGWNATVGNVSIPAPEITFEGRYAATVPGGTALLVGTTLPGLSVTGGGRTVKAGDDGRFELPIDAPAAIGDYSIPVTVSAASISAASGTAMLRVGAAIELAFGAGPLGFRGAEADARVTSDGAPVAGLPIVFRAGDVEVEVVTDVNGRASARIPIDAAGRHEVVARIDAPGYVPVEERADVRVFTYGSIPWGLAALGAIVAAVRLFRPTVRLLLPARGLALEAPPRAVEGEPLAVAVRVRAPSVVSLRIETAARAVVERGTFASDRARFEVLSPPAGPLLVEASVSGTRWRRGRTVRRTVHVMTYAEALEEAGETDLARLARWGPPARARDVWTGGGGLA